MDVQGHSRKYIWRLNLLLIYISHWPETHCLEVLFSYPSYTEVPGPVAGVPASHMHKVQSAPSLSNTCREVKEEHS